MIGPGIYVPGCSELIRLYLKVLRKIVQIQISHIKLTGEALSHAQLFTQIHRKKYSQDLDAALLRGRKICSFQARHSLRRAREYARRECRDEDCLAAWSMAIIDEN